MWLGMKEASSYGALKPWCVLRYRQYNLSPVIGLNATIFHLSLWVLGAGSNHVWEVQLRWSVYPDTSGPYSICTRYAYWEDRHLVFLVDSYCRADESHIMSKLNLVLFDCVVWDAFLVYSRVFLRVQSFWSQIQTKSMYIMRVKTVFVFSQVQLLLVHVLLRSSLILITIQNNSNELPIVRFKSTCRCYQSIDLDTTKSDLIWLCCF